MREGRSAERVTYNTNGGADKISPESKAVATHSFKEMLKRVDEVIEVKLDLIDEVSLVDEDFNEMFLALRRMAINIRDIVKAQHKIDSKQEEDNLWKEMMKFRDPEAELTLKVEENKDKIKPDLKDLILKEK
jgi:cytochrome c556